MIAGYLKQRNEAVLWIRRKKEKRKKHESKYTADNDENLQKE